MALDDSSFTEQWANLSESGMDRTNHYEAAFEAYLQRRQLCYVAVDETRRATLGDVRIKNLDFIIHGRPGVRLLVDVKGRRFPAGSTPRLRRVWESWSTQDDIVGLDYWTKLFGSGYQPLLLFAYHLTDPQYAPGTGAELWLWRDRYYIFRAVHAHAYRDHMHERSPRWQTVSISGQAYRELVKPFEAFLHKPPFSAEGDHAHASAQTCC